MDRRYKAVKAEEILSSTGNVLVQLWVSQDEVEKTDITRAKQQLNELRKAGKKAKNCLMFTFMGYDSDNREVFQIPEIRKYAREVFSVYPELFYFLNIPSYAYAYMANAIFLSQVEVTRAERYMKDFAATIGDTDQVILPSYYAANQASFHE